MSEEEDQKDSGSSEEVRLGGEIPRPSGKRSVAVLEEYGDLIRDPGLWIVERSVYPSGVLCTSTLIHCLGYVLRSGCI